MYIVSCCFKSTSSTSLRHVALNINRNLLELTLNFIHKTGRLG